MDKYRCMVPQGMQPQQPQPQFVKTQMPNQGVQQQYVVGGMPTGTVVMGGLPTTNAQLALILSIVSIFAGGLCLAIPSLILANGALKVTNQIPGHPDGQQAKIAMIISWVVIGLYTLIILFYAFLLASLTSMQA